MKDYKLAKKLAVYLDNLFLAVLYGGVSRVSVVPPESAPAPGSAATTRASLVPGDELPHHVRGSTRLAELHRRDDTILLKNGPAPGAGSVTGLTEVVEVRAPASLALRRARFRWSRRWLLRRLPVKRHTSTLRFVKQGSPPFDRERPNESSTHAAQHTTHGHMVNFESRERL